MKAVIMAGGVGSRLHPLTHHRPKPMLPVANAPVMEHIVRLLRKHGFRDVTATLQYMPWFIQSHFGDGAPWGVSMSYQVEREPLGTAGGVRALARDLDDTYLIISGDALTDFDLTSLLHFHRRHDALVTMALRRVEDVRQFGVVDVDGEGRIRRFQEKPAPSEAFSNLCNTGIYVIEGRALAAVPAGTPWDFARNLFPLLLARGERLFGCELAGYWCDIGTPASYVQANWDCLTGQVEVEIPGHPMGHGVWLGDGVELGRGVRVEGPALIGDGVRIGRGTRVGPLTILGSGASVEETASLEGALLWDGVRLKEGDPVSCLVAYGPGALALPEMAGAARGAAPAAGRALTTAGAVR